MSGSIPINYLTNMGTYKVEVHDETITVKTAEFATRGVVESHTAEFCAHLKTNSVKVIGLDLKMKAGSKYNYMLVMYASKRCLVFHSDRDSMPHSSVTALLKDSSICFVGPVKAFNSIYDYHDKYKMIDVGDLAARALKKPSLTTSPLAEIAREVGITFRGIPTGTGREVEVDQRNPMVLTEKMMATTISDAVAHYNIGFNLLKNLSDDKLIIKN